MKIGQMPMEKMAEKDIPEPVEVRKS